MLIWNKAKKKRFCYNYVCLYYYVGSLTPVVSGTGGEQLRGGRERCKVQSPCHWPRVNKPTTEFIHGDKNKIKPFSSDTPESDVQFPTPFQKLR